MPSPPRRGRISYRDQLLQNQKALDVYAAMADKPRLVLDIPPAPKRREARAEPSVIPLEKDVQKAIIDGLRMHPMVGLVERINSGTAAETDQHGDTRYIQFVHVYSVGGQRFRSVDVHCTLHGGSWAGKRFVVEVKRPGWKHPRGARELEQEAYIHHVRQCGGHGLFATSWEDVSHALEGIRRCHQNLKGGPPSQTISTLA